MGKSNQRFYAIRLEDGAWYVHHGTMCVESTSECFNARQFSSLNDAENCKKRIEHDLKTTATILEISVRIDIKEVL